MSNELKQTDFQFSFYVFFFCSCSTIRLVVNHCHSFLCILMHNAHEEIRERAIEKTFGMLQIPDCQYFD